MNSHDVDEKKKKKNCVTPPTAWTFIIYSTLYYTRWMSIHLDLNKSIQHTACAAKKAVGILIAKSRSSGGFTFDVYFHLFQTLVLPIINYTAAIWGHREYSCIQQIQNQAMRAILGVGRVAPICALQGDLGWAPMVVYTKCEVVKLWHRLCSLPSTRISSKIFRWLGNLSRKTGYNPLDI